MKKNRNARNRRRRATSALRWYGAKVKLVQRLGPLPPHSCYLETHCGSCALLYAKEPAAYECVNDLDAGLVNYLKVLQNPRDGRELVRRLRDTELSEEERRRCIEGYGRLGDEVEWARQLFVRTFLGFNGCASGSCRKVTADVLRRWWGWLERLGAAGERLRKVRITCADFEEPLQEYDREDALIWSDPTYLEEVRKSFGDYRCESSPGDHLRMLQRLRGSKGRRIVCAYESGMYEGMLAGWWRLRIPMRCAATIIRPGEERRRRDMRFEMLYLSFEPLMVPKGWILRRPGEAERAA